MVFIQTQPIDFGFLKTISASSKNLEFL